MSPTTDRTVIDGEDAEEDAAAVEKLKAARASIAAIVASSADLAKSLEDVDEHFALSLETLDEASDAVAPLQSQSITAKALHARINRAVAPALSVLRSFSLVESLQRRLQALSAKPATARTNLSRLLKYVDCVDRLKVAVGTVTLECEPAVQKLQEAVEFLSRTKATDQLRLHRLRETLAAIKALYETEVDSLRYEGVLDEALLRLQDDYEGILLQIKHRGIGVPDADDVELEFEASDDGSLGTDLEVEVLRRISETLDSNDCLDICIDIYVKVRYRRAAKALMRLNPTYLKTYAAEDVDRMEWEVLESAITLWIEHFQLAVQVVFVAEKTLCSRVLSGIMGGAVWPECFAKIADKIMAVFFRFGEGVARSSKEPQKLFKLLDMYDAMDRMRGEVQLVFDGESGADICVRFRELQKQLVDTTSKVFWEFGLQVEGSHDGAPPPADGSVPNIVRYAVNYLKCLAATGYAATMEHVLRTEQSWKSGYPSRPEADGSLLQEAVSTAMDALMRNVEAKRSRLKDRTAAHVLAMNSYWYMYMRTKGSELAKLVGEETMKRKYKMAAEEAAYSYQAQAWGPLAKLLEREEPSPRTSGSGGRRDANEIIARGKMEAFARELEENLRRHRGLYSVPDVDLREQIKSAVAKMVMPAYVGFLQSYSGSVLGRSALAPDTLKELLGRLFEGSGEGAGGGGRARRVETEVVKTTNYVRRRESRNRTVEPEETEGGRRMTTTTMSEGVQKPSFRTRRFTRDIDEDERSDETRDSLRGERRERTVTAKGERKSSFQKREFVWRLEAEEDEGEESDGRSGGTNERRNPTMIENAKTSFGRRRFRKNHENEGAGREEIVEGKKPSFGRRELVKEDSMSGRSDLTESDRVGGEARGLGRERREIVEAEKVSSRRRSRVQNPNARREERD